MAGKRSRILVVDDIPDWRKTFSGMLSEAGYKVDTADSVANALTALESQNFDLALIDIRLDETDENNTDGLKLATSIKQRWPTVNIIIITGYETPETVKQAMEPQGADERLANDFITKADISGLLRSIQELLGKQEG